MVGETDGFQHFKNKLPREGGEGGFKIKKESARVKVPLAIGRARSMLHLKNILENGAAAEKPTLLTGGPLRKQLAKGNSEARRQYFRVTIRAR